MTPALDTHVLIAAFVDELVRLGMTDACSSPGSRSTPLVLALVRDGRLRTHSHIDERSSGFFALGAAKASGRPVAVTCTSGTAAANLHPAVLEADEARVPLLILTADRPPELRDVGAGQAVDQLKLYGGAVRWFFEVGTHEATPQRVRWIRALACRAWDEALGERPGPVHLNWPLREPLSVEHALPPPGGGRADGAPWVRRQRPHATAASLAQEIEGSLRGVIVAGRCEPGLAPALPRLAEAARYPLLADPLSGARGGAAAIAHYDALLRSERFADAHRPQVIVRIGDLPTSKPLRAWLAAQPDAQQIAIDPQGAWQDPDAVIARSLRADPRLLVAPVAAPDGWLEAWRAADVLAAAAIGGELGEQLNEPNVARALGGELGADATLFVAASMAVRELEAFWPVREPSPRVLSNRGANGIDGTISSAFGAAAVSDGPVFALLGDVAFAHDIGGLLAARRLGLELTLVLIDNGGGAIFDRLAVAAARDIFEQHVATPTGLDFAAAAALYGFSHTRVESIAALGAALRESGDGSRLIELRTDRAAGLALHRRIEAAVGEALAAAASA